MMTCLLNTLSCDWQSILLSQLAQSYGFVYLLTAALVRISVIILMRRIFFDKSIAPISRILANILIAISLAQFFISECIFIFRCYPVKYGFNVAETWKAKCLDNRKSGYSTAGTHLILDTAVLILPMYSIWKLQLPLRDRLRIMAVFLLGIFACICAALRFVYISKIVTGLDVTCKFLDYSESARSIYKVKLTNINVRAQGSMYR